MKRASNRRGLAPLEMVLWLPILVAIMALMIGFGAMVCWKVRGLCVARHAAWGSRWPRTGFTNPRPRYWPESAGVWAGAAGNVPVLDDPRVDHPVVRGPLPYGTTVNEQLLDPTRGLHRGTAHISRRLPLVTRRLAEIGRYHWAPSTCLLDDRWQYQQMGLWNNRLRRIPVIYVLARAPAGLVSAYVNAVMSILNAPFRPQLRPLDRDDEFIGYAERFGWGFWAPDFHPRLRRFCSLDHELAERRVEDLIDRIQGGLQRDQEGHLTRRIPSVADRMAGSFIWLYRRVIGELRARSAPNPPPPAAQAEINRLQANIDVLNQYRATLRSSDGRSSDGRSSDGRSSDGN